MKTLKLMMLFMAFTAVAAMPLLTSCGKDDDEKAPADPSGTYTGEISIVLPMLGTTTTPNAVAVVEKTGNAYSLTLTNLGIAVPQVATIAIGDVTFPDITYANGALGGGTPQSKDVTLPEAFLGMPGVTDSEITVTVSLATGTVKGNNLKFTLNVATGISLMPSVLVTFDGNK